MFQSDVSLDPGSEDCIYIILTNKGDPLGAHSLIHRSQVQQGEVVAWDVSWFENGSFDVPYFTILGEVKDRTEYKGLMATASIPKDEARVIARVTLPRPSNWEDSELFVASWTNPRGRTMRTKFYRIPKQQAESLDMYRPKLGRRAPRGSSRRLRAGQRPGYTVDRSLHLHEEAYHA